MGARASRGAEVQAGAVGGGPPATCPGHNLAAHLIYCGSASSSSFAFRNQAIVVASVPGNGPVHRRWCSASQKPLLRLRAVGENPKAVDTAGISVETLRYRALLIGGILCGIGGVYLSTAYNAQFVKDMTAGSGFIALAALIFGKWHPYKVLAACFLFAFLDAISIRLQGIVIPGIGEIPVQLIEATPYILTIILLAGFIGKAVPPKASAQPYIKEL